MAGWTVAHLLVSVDKNQYRLKGNKLKGSSPLQEAQSSRLARGSICPPASH